MRSIFAALVAALVLAAGLACAQQGGKQGEDAAETEALPRLGDIMVQQQLHHIKLWFAGNSRNWALADYELDQLKDGFDDVAKLLGGELAQQHVGDPLSQLEKSIDTKDHEAFVSAFDQLSAGCNACHHTLDHAFVAIQRPTVLPYSDQNFSPQ